MAAARSAAARIPAPARVLIALVALGVVLRVLMAVGLWPTTITLDDAYEDYARTNPFNDPLHPAGYPLILAALGAVTRQVAVTIVVQHTIGLVSGLLMWDATKRVTGSPWPGLAPAAILLLAPDVVFLEHALMSESWAILATTFGFWCAARWFDEPRAWRWSLLTGATLALAACIRTAGLPVIVVVLLVVVLAQPPDPGARWRRWTSAVPGVLAAAVVLLGLALANAAFGPRLGLSPSPGWHAYGRAAEFADCSRFTPPPGSEPLCERRPASVRPGTYYYLFVPTAPAPRTFGAFGTQDALLGAWARRAVRAQPLDYAASVWRYLRVYFVPSWKPHRLYGSPLDPQLNPRFRLNAIYQSAIKERQERFYDPYRLRRRRGVLAVVRAWQRVVRFGGAALTIATLLTLAGLVVAPSRRGRAGIALFGLGGLAMLVSPALGSTASGRYTVPMAGPMLAAAAIVVWERVRRSRISA